MARRRRGNPVDGWVVLDKPLGLGSTQAVGKVRWAFGARKAGHAGTLDPLATGVLAIALGEATKAVPLVQEGAKTYRFTVRLGQATETDDAEGAVTAESPDRPDDAAIAAALEAFEGDILQVPPRFSAVKVAGARAYDLARAARAGGPAAHLDLAPRPLHVASIRLVSRPDRDLAEIEMTCGKGGYVRSVARDLGAALGCFGHVVALRRLKAGPFGLEDAISFERLEEIRHTGAFDDTLLPVSTGLDDIPAVAVDQAAAARLRQGQAVPVTRSDLPYGSTAWARLGDAPVAVGQVRGGALHPHRVFNLDN
ncbi:MAG TPA: tRNA pseudouridine(55) synthase TruB [Thermohalobaculum sp.]|nr:tRNA pseudouridine(55) synthase TruB [Thermohalobaculum sp.]